VIATLGIDVAAWVAWGVATGWLAHRLRFDQDTWLTRPRAVDATLARRLHLRTWQRHLPDFGRVFGTRSNRHVGSRDTETLRAYATETRRAEMVHWANLAVAPLFGLWNPAWLTAVMIVYAVAANGPCLLSLRVNRRRIGRILDNRQSRVPRSQITDR
jgi:glycosyl-4,4'-diaponeurosporenoate acyltransferase